MEGIFSNEKILRHRVIKRNETSKIKENVIQNFCYQDRFENASLFHIKCINACVETI